MKAKVLLFVLCSVHLVESISLLVRSSDSTATNTSKTFNHYVLNAETYFNFNTVLYFMEGYHFLNTTLSLNNYSNLTFMGSNSTLVLSEGCSIILKNTYQIVMKLLKITFVLANGKTDYSALIFKNSYSAYILNVSFSRMEPNVLNYSRALQVQGSEITFRDCSFENGYHISGGALTIKRSSVFFLGINSFRYNSAKVWGGAIAVSYSKLQFNGINIFEKNKAGKTSAYSGGAALVITQTNTSFKGLIKFIANEYLSYSSPHDHGGAIAAYGHSELIIEGNASFINNINKYGGAIVLRFSLFQTFGKICFINNSAIHKGGAVYALESSLLIHSDPFAYNSISRQQACLNEPNKTVVLFCSNSARERGGAIHLERSNLTVHGSIYFGFNTAQNGGGISMLFTSESSRTSNHLTLQHPIYLEFFSNIAKRAGGAMYIDDIYVESRLCEYLKYHEYIIPCFFKLKYEFISPAEMTMTDNLAAAGKSIYGGALQYCRVLDAGTYRNGFKVLQRYFMTNDKIENLYESAPSLEVRFCGNFKDNFLPVRSVDISVQRGQLFNVSVIVLGEFDFPVEDRAAFSLMSDLNEYSSQLFGEPYNYAKSSGCRNLGFRILTPRNMETLSLYPPQCNIETATLFINLRVMECSSGFVLVDNACKCDESIAEVTGYNNLCDATTGLVKCPQFDWMKPLFDSNTSYIGLMWSKDCPQILCRSSSDTWLNFSSQNGDILCKQNRTGIVCGACRANHSLLLSSLKCSKCTDHRYLSLLVAFAAAGIAVITILLFFQLTIATGTINGLILYANIVSICQDIIIPIDKNNTKPFRIFLAWLNLDLGISTCLYNGLDAYTYIWLQFLFPFYLWLLVGLIICFCKFSSKAVKILGSNPVAVLATVVLLSYNKLLYNSQEILSHVTVSYSNGFQESRWKIDPNLLYFQGKHIPLALFAIMIVSVFLIPYTFLLIFGYCFQIRSQKRGLRWINTFKPILDAYYAPYTKTSRYWIGLQLCTRVLISTSYSVFKHDKRDIILIIVAILFSVMAIIPWITEKIYEKKLLNFIEVSFIFNVIILSFVSYYFKQVDKSHQLIVYNISSGFAFLLFMIIIIYHFYQRFKLESYFKKFTHRFTSKTLFKQSNSGTKDLQTTEANESSTNELQRIEGRNKPIVITTDFLREPLLEESCTKF